MFNVCENCGQYRADKAIETHGEDSFAVCPECGFRRRFLRLPLFIVGGASGTGKSAVCLRLAGRLSEAVVLESDVLWMDAFADPEQYPVYFDLWLRMAKNIAQSGRPVLLFGAGLGVPANIEPRIERRYFSRVHYLALVCDEAQLAARLRARPAWRHADADAWIAGQVDFNRWYREEAPHGQPAVDLLDTTRASVTETAEQVSAWLRRSL